MANLKVVDMTGKGVGEMTVSDAVFAQEVNTAVLHAAVKQYLVDTVSCLRRVTFGAPQK